MCDPQIETLTTCFSRLGWDVEIIPAFVLPFDTFTDDVTMKIIFPAVRHGNLGRWGMVTHLNKAAFLGDNLTPLVQLLLSTAQEEAGANSVLLKQNPT